MINKIHILGILSLLIGATGFTSSPPIRGRQVATVLSARTLALRFKHSVGDKALTLSGETYLDPYGEPFTVEKFKYYIAHLTLTGENNTRQVIFDEPHLVDENDSSTKTITISTTLLRIKSIEFVLGVDSIKNVSGAQEGDLDPLKGMFWTWNSGYVFAKLEGKSDSSRANAHFLSWHIGGFRQDQNALRWVRLAVQQEVPGVSTAYGASIAAGNSGSSVASPSDITIHADILKWFNAIHPIRISQSPVCHDPGPLALQIADNYAAMFSIER